MFRFSRYALVFVALQQAACLSHADVVLDGRSATPESIARIADGEKVRIDPAALRRVAQAHRVLLEAAQAGQQIYGLTTGVGLNKDRAMVDARGKLSQDIIDASSRFNIGLLKAHGGGTGPDMALRTARATMAARLNAMLDGGAGVQSGIVDTYVQFLNRGITPVMPSAGSMGEADITILGHVGLAMLGDGEVYFQGRKLPAAEALRQTGVAPIKPFGKDALAILSSNAYASAMAALALDDMARLRTVSKLVYALSLQALNGNVSPFLQDTLALRPFPYTAQAGSQLRGLLAGSSIWDRDDKRALQDPLSFRSGVYLLGEEDRTFDATRALLNIQLNSSDDNPGVAVDVTPHSNRAQESRGYVKAADIQGAVLPSANFDPLPWVVAFQEMGLALAHSSMASAQRIVKLNDPHFTGLPRFLGGEGTVHAFGAMEKPVMALASENRELALPVSLDYLPVAGGVEDIATNAPRVVERVQRQIDNSFALLGIELIHAAQAIDLRKQQQPGFTLSPPTAELYGALRKQVAFLDTDRPMTPDFRAAAALLASYR
ncbi:histidine ammonia-lyase [Pseudorhodoferax sp. Leaf274]|uniref:HAL/PAL/TAL family ammonia-lyase n=1 Tax=Pseudorhodoferax sp. Leaf274 TaxID=1736318 RepID=UPI0007031D50|nr:sugar transporter [Pseudorhodoferax sp. Leaf274]